MAHTCVCLCVCVIITAAALSDSDSPDWSLLVVRVGDSNNNDNRIFANVITVMDDSCVTAAMSVLTVACGQS